MKVLNETKFPNYYIARETRKDVEGEYTHVSIHHRMGHGLVELKKLSSHVKDVLVFYYPMTNKETDTFVWFRV